MTIKGGAVRVLLSLILVATLALPAVADDDSCVTVQVFHEPHLSVQVDDPSPLVPHAFVGSYIWFAWGPHDEGRENTLSFDISDEDIESVRACPDGTATIQRTEPPVEDSPTPTTTPDEPSEPTEPEPPLRTVCDTYRTSLGVVCELPNLRLVIN